MEDPRTIEDLQRENAQLKALLENARLQAEVEALPPKPLTVKEAAKQIASLVSGPFKVLDDGRIDCNFEHPTHGILRYTADPAEHETLLCRAIHAVAKTKA
jgi:hypothetical protein